MRLIGGMLLLAAGTLLGCSAAHHLDTDVRRIRLLRQLVTAMISELRGTLPLVTQLLQQTAAMPQFAELSFLQYAAQHAAQFPDCWMPAITADPALTPPERAVLETIGQTLGSTTLDGQVAALSLCAERLSLLQSDAEHAAKQKGGLCRSLGVLGSLFLVILLL